MRAKRSGGGIATGRVSVAVVVDAVPVSMVCVVVCEPSGETSVGWSFCGLPFPPSLYCSVECSEVTATSLSGGSSYHGIVPPLHEH